MLSESQVSKMRHLHNFPFVHDVSCANTSEPSKCEKQTLVANSTAFACHLVRVGDKNDIDLQNSRGQGYDNGANMAGIDRGAQAFILGKNPQAMFSPVCVCV